MSQDFPRLLSDLRFFGPRHYFYVIISDEASAPRVYFSNV